MEPITWAAIISSFIFGALLGFITMSTGNIGIKVLVDGAGGFGLVSSASG